MTDVRARLADALRDENLKFRNGHLDGIEWCLATADILLSLDGIAIVELPEPMNVTATRPIEGEFQFPHDILAYPGGVTDCDADLEPKVARSIGAALLAAANAAEIGDPNE